MIRIEDRAGENILIWPDGSSRPATDGEIFLDRERDALRERVEVLRALLVSARAYCPEWALAAINAALDAQDEAK